MCRRAADARSAPPRVLVPACARSQLRRQIGTLRFDLDNLVAAKGSGAAEVDALTKDVRARSSSAAQTRQTLPNPAAAHIRPAGR